ncbi:MAG: HIT domain-containing protein [Nanoarchaeota archaeon]|nr:HIT domain-containing protein [Nanoarchaeota archaeon]
MKEGKLVRDGIIKILKEDKIEHSYHIASKNEFGKKLDEKLVEEVYEFLESKNEEEISDVEEVLSAIKEFYSLDKEKIELIKKNKYEKRGGFRKRIILDEVKENNPKIVDNCFFCQVYGDGKEVESENNHFYTRFDRFPITPGHIEIIPKRHVVTLDELTPHEWASLNPIIKETLDRIVSSNLEEKYFEFLENPINSSSENFLRKAVESPFIHLRPDAYTHGINDGEASGRTVHHLHWHIIPRYVGDVPNPRGGVRHIIPEKGFY